MIAIKDLSKTYSQTAKSKAGSSGPLYVLKDINLSIEQGDIFGIIGKSGAGKSTLLKCVNLLTPPSAGDVIIQNQSTHSLPESELRRLRLKMGKIFQQFHLLRSRTVSDNIALPLEFLKYDKKRIHQRVAELLEIVGLSEHANKYPSQLSGGQKQRVAIARAIASNPVILLSDEATSALDPAATQDILNLLKRINKELNLTLFLITHEMDVAKSICNRIAVIDDGKIIEQGSVIDIFIKPQHQITQELIRKSTMLEVPGYIQNMLKPTSGKNASRIVRLAYHGEKASQPIISYLISQYQIVINILQGFIETIQDQPMGVMIIEIRGDEENVRKGIEFFERNGVIVETLGYVTFDH